MNITHKHIKQSLDQIRQKHVIRQNELRSTAQKIFDDYEESLELESAYFFDGAGAKHSYVRTGFKNEKGELEHMLIDGLSLDKDYKLNFLIYTVIDNSPVGNWYQHAVSISLYKEAGEFFVEVGTEKKIFRVNDPDADGAFYGVSNAIKDQIVKAFTDSRLD